MRWKEEKEKRGRSRRVSAMFCGQEVQNWPPCRRSRFPATGKSSYTRPSYHTTLQHYLPMREHSHSIPIINERFTISVIDDLWKNDSVEGLEILHTDSLSNLEKTIFRNKCAGDWFDSRIVPTVEKIRLFLKIHKKYLEMKICKSNYVVLFLEVQGTMCNDF